jgi:hypothetical protein
MAYCLWRTEMGPSTLLLGLFEKLRLVVEAGGIVQIHFRPANSGATTGLGLYKTCLNM